MTKRLFAIVLAAILAITMFTFPAFAEGETTGTQLTYESNSKSITASWQILGADIVRYDLTLYRDGIKVTSASVTDVTKPLTYVFSNITTGGNYEVVVDGKTTNNINAKPDKSVTLTGCSVPVSSSSGSGTKKITVSSNNNILTAAWEAQDGATTYRIDFSYKKNGTTYSNTAISSTNTYNFSGLTYSDLVSVKVTAGNANGYNSTNFASWTNSGVSGSGSSSSSNGVTTTGAVEATVQNGYVYITIKDNPYYSYRYGVMTTTSTAPTYQYLGTSRNFYIPISSMYGGMYITVEGTNTYTTSQYGNWGAVGSVTVMGYNTGFYPWGGNTGWGNSGVQISNSNGVPTAYWGAVSGAMGYHVRITASNGTSLSDYTSYNYYQLPASGTSTGWNIVVYAMMSNGQSTYVGTGYATSSTTGTTNPFGITKSEVKNLTVTPVSNISTKLTWNRYNGASYYYIVYGGLDGSNLSENMVYQTTANVPYNSNTAYYATVYAMSSNGTRLAEVGHVYNVPGTTDDDGNTTSGKDYPSNFTAKSKDKKISLSWKAAEDASYYNIYYKRATSSSWTKISQKITKTAVNISGLTNGIEYDFKVVPNKGSESGVATIAPSASSSKTVTARDPSSSSSDDGDINLDDEELTITSVSSSSTGKIKITWSNVGAPSYRIYVAEGTSSSYKACGTYTGTSATISTFGTGSKATSFKSGKTYKVRIIRTDYTGALKDALKACPYKTVTVK